MFKGAAAGSMVIAVGLLACGKDKPKTAPAELAKQGAVMATVASLPRADWPTQLTSFDANGYKQVATFTYASDEPCRIPIVAHGAGIVGCPSGISRTYSDGSTGPTDVRYDDKRRMIHDSLKDYRWDGDVVVAQKPKWTYRKLETVAADLGRYHDENKRFDEVYHVREGRLTAEFHGQFDFDKQPNEVGTATKVLTWGPKRLLSIRDGQWNTYLEYADTPSPVREEEIARKKREELDREVAKLATTRSVPRADWPCSRTIAYSDKTSVTYRFTYGELADCVMPLENQADGITGCPISVTQETIDEAGTTTTKDPEPWRYEGDRLIFGPRAHQWREDGLYAGHGGGRFVKTPSGVLQTIDAATISFDITDGKLVGYKTVTQLMTVSGTVTWTGNRIERLDTVMNDLTGVGTFTYDCK